MTERPAVGRPSRPSTGSRSLRQFLLGVIAMGGALGASALGGSLVSLAATTTSYQILVADGPSGTIYVNDPSAGSVTPVPAPVSGGIQSLAISPDGSTVYVAFKDGSIGIMATASDTYLGAPIDLGSTSSPAGMVVTPNGQDLYVAESGLGQVVEVDTIEHSLVGSPMVTGPALNLAISPDGSSLFVDGGSLSNSVTVVSTATDTVNPNPIPVSDPGAMAMSADGTALYVISSPTSGPAVVVIDPATGKVSGPPVALPATSQPAQLALSPDGSELYVTDANGQAVARVDTTTATLNSATIALPQGLTPRDITVTADGTTAYLDGTAVGGTSELVSVDLATGSVSSPVILAGGQQPVSLVLAPLAAASTPTAAPTPTPTPTCGPVMIDPIEPVGPVEISPSSQPPAAGANSGASGAAPASTPPTAPTAAPSSTTLPPAPDISPSPSGSPSSPPVICFGAQAAPGFAHPDAALASGTAADPSGRVILWAALVLLALAGAAALVVRHFGLTGRKLPRFRHRRSG